jgi:hypothetical protein
VSAPASLGKILRYALTVCPWIFGRTDTEPESGIEITDSFVSARYVTEEEMIQFSNIYSGTEDCDSTRSDK